MAYTKTVWQDNTTLVAAAPLNNIENGVAAVDTSITSLTSGKQNATTYSSTPPGSPADGDLWCFPADATGGIMWLFRYRAASASAYKWEFVGGPPLVATFNTEQGVAAVGTWIEGAPALTVPRAGDYQAGQFATANAPSAALCQVALTTDGANPATNGIEALAVSSAAAVMTLGRSGVPITLAASANLRHLYWNNIANVLWSDRHTALIPVRVI